jgi:hypothetical protein
LEWFKKISGLKINFKNTSYLDRKQKIQQWKLESLLGKNYVYCSGNKFRCWYLYNYKDQLWTIFKKNERTL